MNIPPQWLAPAATYRLAAAWLFVDAFSGRAVDVPLSVRVDAINPPYPSMPRLPWRAVRGADATYRFVYAEGTALPRQTMSVTCDIPGGAYRAFEALSMTVPRTAAIPNHPTRADFLIVTRLWPTRVFRIPFDETAITGEVLSSAAHPSVAGLKVTVWSAQYGGIAPPNAPYTYTDARGDFVVRLLGKDYRIHMSGVNVTSTADIYIELRTPPPPYQTVVATVSQTIPLGQNTLLEIP
jgi:hypothetical protein